jgi:hypothetical protein
MVKLRQYYELRTTNYELRIELLSLSEGFEFDTKYEQEFIAFLKLNGATVQRALIETGHSSPRRRLAATSICVRHINGGHRLGLPGHIELLPGAGHVRAVPRLSSYCTPLACLTAAAVASRNFRASATTAGAAGLAVFAPPVCAAIAGSGGEGSRGYSVATNSFSGRSLNPK